MKIYQLFYLLTAFFCMLATDAVSNDKTLEPSHPLHYTPQAFDVLEYNLVIDLTAAPTKYIEGKNIVKVLWTGNPDTTSFYFHLKSFSIDSAYIDGLRVMINFIEFDDNTNSKSYCSLDMPKVNSNGDTSVIELFYHGTMTNEGGSYAWGGVHTSNGVLYALGVGFHNSYVSATRHWMPCYDHPSDKAKFKTSIKVKKEHLAVSTGLLRSIEEEGNNRVFNWVHDYECATYLLTFAAGNLIEIPFDNYKDIPVRCYTIPFDSSVSIYTYGNLNKMLEAYEFYFSDYPFERVAYVNTDKGAMEHQTLVSFPTSLVRSIFKNKDSMNLTVAHELSHQWFGDLVTPEDFRDAWLNEGFAVFCEALLLEYHYGKKEYFQKLSQEKNAYLTSTTSNEGVLPLYDFDRESPSSNYPATIYQKGALVVGMLRYELGDSIFFSIIRDYLEEYSYGNTNTNNLYELIIEKSGKDLDWFFRQWVYGKGWPELDVHFTITPDGSEDHLTIEADQIQDETIGLFSNIPLEIEVIYNGIADTLIKVLNINEQSFIETIPQLSDISAVRVSNIHKVCALIEYDETITSLPDVSQMNDIMIFPNPVNDVLVISIPGIDTDFELILTDQLGKAAITPMIYKNGSGDIKLDVSKLNNGIYSIIIHSGIVSKYSKFTVCK